MTVGLGQIFWIHMGELDTPIAEDQSGALGAQIRRADRRI